MDERLVQFDEKMQKTMNNLSEEFGSIRAGRANPHVLDKLRVIITEHQHLFSRWQT